MDVSHNPTGTHRDCGLCDLCGYSAHMRLVEPSRPKIAIWEELIKATVDYLLKPPSSLHAPRHGAAIAILVLYSILLLLIALTYLRLLYTVTHNPGYVPRGPQWHAQRERKRREKRQHSRDYRKTQSPVSSEGDVITSSGDAFAPTTTEPAPGLRDFYSKDAFVCQGDGRPIWCSTCLNWKPDRTHHCREIERCVRKMDHFCPW